MKLSEIVDLITNNKSFDTILKKHNLILLKNSIVTELKKTALLSNKIFLKEERELDLFDDEKSLFVFSDGAASGNPGRGGCGCVIFDSANREVASAKKFLGNTTNNIAEYSALILAVETLENMELYDYNLRFFADSELMVKQIRGEYKISNFELKSLYLEFFEKIKKFKSFMIEHIPREKNKIADKLAVEAKNSVES